MIFISCGCVWLFQSMTMYQSDLMILKRERNSFGRETGKSFLAVNFSRPNLTVICALGIPKDSMQREGERGSSQQKWLFLSGMGQHQIPCPSESTGPIKGYRDTAAQGYLRDWSPRGRITARRIMLPYFVCIYLFIYLRERMNAHWSLWACGVREG